MYIKMYFKMYTKRGKGRLKLLKALLNYKTYFGDELFKTKRTVNSRFDKEEGYIFAKLIYKAEIILKHYTYTELDALKKLGYIDKRKIICEDLHKSKRRNKMVVCAIKRDNNTIGKLMLLFLHLGIDELCYFITSDYFQECKDLWKQEKKHFKNMLKVSEKEFYTDYGYLNINRTLLEKFLTEKDFIKNCLKNKERRERIFQHLGKIRAPTKEDKWEFRKNIQERYNPNILGGNVRK